MLLFSYFCFLALFYSPSAFSELTSYWISCTFLMYCKYMLSWCLRVILIDSCNIPPWVLVCRSWGAWWEQLCCGWYCLWLYYIILTIKELRFAWRATMLQSIDGWLEILDYNPLSIVSTVVLLVDIRDLPRLLDVSVGLPYIYIYIYICIHT